MVWLFLSKHKMYLLLSLLILLLSLAQPIIALFGVSLFLTLLICSSVSRLWAVLEHYDPVPRSISILFMSLLLFIPSFYITPFFNSLIILLSSYFLIVLLFKLSQKMYLYCQRKVEIEKYAYLAAIFYFAVGMLLLLNARVTLEALLTHPTGNIFVLVGLLVGISFISTGMRFITHRPKLHERKLINSRNILFIFFIFFFSFLSGATFEGIVLMKIVSNAGLALFLFGIPLLRLWKQRKNPHYSMRAIVDSIYAE